MTCITKHATVRAHLSRCARSVIECDTAAWYPQKHATPVTFYRGQKPVWRSRDLQRAYSATVDLWTTIAVLGTFTHLATSGSNGRNRQTRKPPMWPPWRNSLRIITNIQCKNQAKGGRMTRLENPGIISQMGLV